MSDLEQEKKSAEKENTAETEKQVNKAEKSPESDTATEQVDVAEKEAPVKESNADPADSEEAEITPEQADNAEGPETADSDEDAGEDTDSVPYYKEILERAKEVAVQEDWAFVTTELSNLAQQITEGPESSDDEVRALIDAFEQTREEFEQRKQAHYDELNRKKEENLARKKELLKQLSDIISEEKWTATKEVGQIRSKWDNIKLLPNSEKDTINERYEELLAEFDDHKVDRLVKKLQKEEENLELKLLLLDKMDSTTKKLGEEEADYKALNKEFNDLLAQWRKVGRVPSEKNEAVWDRYNTAQDAFNTYRLKHDKKYREKIEKSLSKKKNLIKEAEALVDMKNIAKAARKVNKLHKAWKKTGNLPQKDENDLWDQFKAATDAFNQKKSDNIEVLRDQEEENYEKKKELVQKAAEAKTTDDFDAGHQLMQDLMEQWKKIGPVPRKKSSKIWKKFKAEMDEFYDRRRDHFKEQRKDHKENLARKNEILEKLRELGKHEDPALAVEEAKKLQQSFKDAGHVPIKVKNKIWKEYREACDVIYDRYRALGSDLGMERKLAAEGIDPKARKEIIKYEKEIGKLKKEISSIESEVIQYKEAKTYFKPTNKGNKLIDELQEKIDKAEEKLDDKADRVYELKKKIDLITAAAEADEAEESTGEEE
ncbi:DUF349 domain-containing protein [Balneola sp. MJW-20]|uniref:DUF349 domain-containing protein n=1 Tax=Gracilimonas aurantiaca TaxID=3234185 RepID=UPI0034657134